MSDRHWLNDAQMRRLEPCLPKSHGKPHLDDRRILNGIIFVSRNKLRWRDASKEYGPHKTLYNRWKRWSDKGVFAQIMMGLAAEHSDEETVMIDTTYLKAHRTTTSMGVRKGAQASDWADRGWHEYQTGCRLRQPWAPYQPAGHVNDYIGARGAVEQPAKRRLFAWRSRIRCRLVPRSLTG